MLPVPNDALPQAHQATLARYQRDVDDKGTYRKRVEAARRLFSSRNRKSNPTFAVVREKLTELCPGLARCMYCEDSAANEVEHIRPKDLYPELVFAWRNFLYACGPCNRRKGNRFSVIDHISGQIIDVTRPKGAAIVPPRPGKAVLINPRRENPLNFLILDLRQTFRYTPIAESGTLDFERAVHTIDVLKLNERDYLVDARETAFHSYRDLLLRYKQQCEGPQKRNALRLIRRNYHPTVWWEMLRQRNNWSVLTGLFDNVPELLCDTVADHV